MTDRPTVRQALLRSGDCEMVTWLNGKQRFRVGDAVTLKNHREPKRLWSILELYGTQRLDQLHSDWHVGGL